MSMEIVCQVVKIIIVILAILILNAQPYHAQMMRKLNQMAIVWLFLIHVITKKDALLVLLMLYIVISVYLAIF